MVLTMRRYVWPHLLRGRIYASIGYGLSWFIGSALVHHLIDHTDYDVLNFDALTYAGTLSTVDQIAQSSRFRFVHDDICEASIVRAEITAFRPDIITHLAAESHVDRSIDSPGAFDRTNVVGPIRCSPRRMALLANDQRADL